jgi:ABC-type Na+ transport system ATPase subunit NatA
VIRPGDRLGILGRNGAGKSTLMRLLGGVEFPSVGRIERRMSVSWPLAHGIGVHSSLTGADNARFIARIYDLDPEDLVDAVNEFAEFGSYMDINTLNERTISDTQRAAQEDVRVAEQRVVAAREAMIAFREREQAFDPQAAAGGAVTTITALQSALAQARTEFAEKRTFMRPDNPMLQVLQNRIAALRAQIAAERQRVTNGAESRSASSRMRPRRPCASPSRAAASGLPC